ncbi:cleavage and polyadenylation specificity factor subunit 7 isoform X2 [Anabrus simplex]
MDRPRPLDHGDPRTPMAWQHRNINYHQQCNVGTGPSMDIQYPYVTQAEDQSVEEESLPYRSRTRARPRPRPRRTSPSSNTSATSASTGLDSDSQAKCEVSLPLCTRPGSRTTWDGEPCPVHHMAMPVGLLLPPPPPLYPLVAMPPQPPPVLLPPMLRPRPLVMAADVPAPPEPLPVRDPKVSVSPLPPKDAAVRPHCCKGNIVVFWIILAIIFVGIVLGVILRFVTT